MRITPMNSEALLRAKEAYTIEAVRQYMAKLGGMDEKELKILIYQLGTLLI